MSFPSFSQDLPRGRQLVFEGEDESDPNGKWFIVGPGDLRQEVSGIEALVLSSEVAVDGVPDLKRSEASSIEG